MSLRFGKLPVKSDYRTLRFGAYATPQLPAPPTSFSILEADVFPSLQLAVPPSDSAVSDLFPMDGNDQYGDCAAAGLAHAVTVWQGMIGTRMVIPQALVEKLYFQLTGGTDSGLVLLDVLNYWRKNRITGVWGGEKIVAYVRLNPHNHTHIQQAISIFGGVYLGFQCQENVESDFEAGRVWTPGKLTNSGHCVYAVGYDPQTVDVLTWGSHHRGTWEWWDQCVDEAYCVLPSSASSPNFAAGFDIAKLRHDLGMVAN